MKLVEALQEFDLNKNEAKVYVELLGLGSTNVGPVITKTKLHRQQVYQALDKLIDLKLATCAIRNNRKYFQASSPTELNKQLEYKKSVAEQIIPALQDLQVKGEDDLEIRLLYGAKGYVDNLKEIVRSAASEDGVIRIIGGVPYEMYEPIAKPFRSTYHQLLKDNDVSRKVIANDSNSHFLKERYDSEKDVELRTISAGISSPSYTRITKEMVSIELFSVDVAVIQICNRKVAEEHLKNFELLWKQAKA